MNASIIVALPVSVDDHHFDIDISSERHSEALTAASTMPHSERRVRRSDLKFRLAQSGGR